MAPPVVHAATQRIYDRLPEHYRLADARVGGPPDYPLLRYLSLLGDQLGELEDLIDRLDYLPPDEGGAPGDTSDLVDAVTADAAWLPWLAQLVGAILPPGLSEASARDAVAFAPAGWRAATKGAIAAAARSALTGTRYVVVNDHYAGDPHRVEVRTRTTETASVPAVLAAIIEKGAKPAGIELVATAYQATWAQVNAEYPTWADLAGKTWAEVLEAGAP